MKYIKDREMGYVIETEVKEREGTPYFDCEITKIEKKKSKNGKKNKGK